LFIFFYLTPLPLLGPPLICSDSGELKWGVGSPFVVCLRVFAGGVEKVAMFYPNLDDYSLLEVNYTYFYLVISSSFFFFFLSTRSLKIKIKKTVALFFFLFFFSSSNPQPGGFPFDLSKSDNVPVLYVEAAGKISGPKVLSNLDASLLVIAANIVVQVHG
jgi:hypothetical protein